MGVASLVFCALTYSNGYFNAQYVISVDPTALVLLTTVASLTILNTLLGYIGLLRHYKPMLIAYLVFLWPLLVSYIAVGYLSYVANEYSGSTLSNVWDGFKNNQKESIQNQFVCCGFLSELDRVALSDQCNIIDTSSSSLVSKRGFEQSSGLIELNGKSTLSGLVAKRGLGVMARQSALAKRQTGSIGLPGCYLTWGKVSSDYLHTITNLGFSSIPFFAFSFIIGVLSINHIYD